MIALFTRYCRLIIINWIFISCVTLKVIAIVMIKCNYQITMILIFYSAWDIK